MSHNSNVDLSRKMAKFLRHSSNLPPDGYVPVDQMLAYTQFRNYTVQEVEQVVINCNKKRFEMIRDQTNGQLKVRACQGHTQQVNLGMELITDGTRFPTVVHGTTSGAWHRIKSSGLKRMNRQHIHFAVGLPGDSSVTSGMPASSEIVIYIDIDSAARDGYKFYRSTNDVILTEGNSSGVLPAQYFRSVVNRRTGERLM